MIPTTAPARRPPARRWAAGLAAGAAGSLTMVATTRLEALLRRRPSGPIDYEESRVALAAVEGVTGWRVRGTAPRHLANGTLRAGLRVGARGGAGAARSGAARRRRGAVAILATGTWVVEVVGLRLLGAAPPPWRWNRRVLVTSATQHLVHAAVVDAAYRRLRADVATGPEAAAPASA